MADKKITDLQQISALSDSANLVTDDGIATYRVTMLQIIEYILSAGRIVTAMIGDAAVTLGKLALDIFNTLSVVTAVPADHVVLVDASDSGKTKKALITDFSVPVGCILPFFASAAPSGFLLCDGSAVSRTTYATLYALIGTAAGQGDGSTTFNLPDLRYKFLRGVGPETSATGSGTAGSNNATFTAHAFTRTGIRVKLSSGALTGLASGTTYYAIVVDANTLAFAASRADAAAGTKVAISGANSAVIVQDEDTSLSARFAQQTGGATGATVGSAEEDAVQAHYHEWSPSGSDFNTTDNAAGSIDSITADQSDGTTAASTFMRAKNYVGDPRTGLSAGGTTRSDRETRPSNVLVNYIIKH